MELIDIRWCMASVMRRAQRFMEITGRSCLGAVDTKLGFDKSKVTYFKCKQKGTLRDTNMQTNEAVNPFRDDYYQKAIYHRISEPPKVNQNKISEGSSKDRKQAMVITQEDEGFNWDKYIPREKYVLVAKVDNRWQRSFAREEINKLYDPFDEAKEAKRWDAEREYYLDLHGNPVVDPNKVKFDDVVAVIPTCQQFYTRRSIEKDYEENLFKPINEVFYASLTKVMELVKKNEEVVEKLVEELKKTVGEAVENQQKSDENPKQTTEESKVPDETEVKIQTDSSESSNSYENVKQSVDKTEEQCRKCMETCRACAEKDENLKLRYFEFTKIETVFKTKCKKMLENEEVLKQKVEKLALKYQDFEKENEILKQKYLAKCNDCL
ncbi:hypothetical protein HanRHA438_Chr08g0371141 [Helianthus annuus]|nr:hypothetical protein HanHA300_Chr08g0296541 [Helianthus annuus]KAJ0548788.1 hypothetical protein HanIR_Chr08g0387731 [Helianthus annuus]KAJ0555032.1 hypothetical protein HanHA89_Chr08g0315051 [Helianthus annuus]KAJ0723793.1 hypothetical protein HanOQP8_Chr08g0302561 [Helianthus annuus]KAJ0899661.1 hypothetical protein HanRHA438_Chr08g0371141 [Helianthus annuus]